MNETIYKKAKWQHSWLDKIVRNNWIVEIYLKWKFLRNKLKSKNKYD